MKLEDSSFAIKLERYVERDGALYDRLLSKWAIYKEGVERDQLVSHAHQADEIHAFQNLPAIKLTSKKGLGGIIPNQYISDFTLLGISSATINVCITQFMHLTQEREILRILMGEEPIIWMKVTSRLCLTFLF